MPAASIASISTRTSPTSRPRWTDSSATSSSSMTSEIRRSRSKSRAGGCRARMRRRVSRRIRGGATIRFTMPCGAATRCTRGAGSPASRSFDVSDIAHPRTLGHHEYDPPHAEPTHTFLKVPFQIGGRSIAVSTEEERPKRGPDVGRPHAPLRTWDVTDPAKPTILCTYQLDETAQPYHGDNVRFGTHQLREIVDRDCMLYVTWFAAGLRMIDIGDPANPREKGYIIPSRRRGATCPGPRRRQGRTRADLLHRQGLRARRHRIRQLMAAINPP